MEEKSHIRSAMVSRLPKFGGRSSTGAASPLSNGSTHPTTPTQDGKTTPSGTRPNGVIRASSFSFKWKRDEGTTPSSPTSPEDGVEEKAQTLLPPLVKEVRNGSPSTPKMRRSGVLTVAISSPKAIPKQSLKMSPKVVTKLDQSPLNGGPKIAAHNGFSSPVRTGSESRLVRPRAGSSSPRSSSQDSLYQSSDSLKTLALDNMVRSNSFTHFKQIPSPTSQPMTRSFSFNRAVELAKPLANTQLRPPRSSFLKPPQLSNGRVGLGLGGLNSGLGGLGGGLQYSRPPSAASSLPTLSIPPAPTTPSPLRKPLLPSCVLNKSLGSSGLSLGYRPARSGQTKQQKPLFPCRVKGDIRPSTAPEFAGLLGIAIDIERTSETAKAVSPSDSDGSSGGGKGEKSVLKISGQTAGETLEDMSLSSASSLDRGDTSEDFLDDFDCLGDGFSDGDLPDNRRTDSTTQTRLHSFLNESLDWDTMDLAGHKEESPMQDSQGPLGLSSEPADVLQASSVEMSPSNSSGGTYMWDEDGLDPLGGPGTHPCDSYDDSDLNSIDMLNNLDPPASGELDEDDLMLDVDLPEEGLHDADRMSHFERSERAGRQGQRRRHHRWSGPDNFYNDSRAHVVQHYDGLKASRISSRSVPSEGRQHGYMAMLDELTLEHVTQDCGSLKNQLLRLKTMLQLEDTDSPADVPEYIEDNTTASQLEELIKEVQVLREELRSRDKTIAQLTLQCQQLQHQREPMPAQGRPVRCQCHHQRAPSSLRQGDRQMDRRTQHHYDKATQTYWRPPSHAPQILQPFNPCLNEHLHQGRQVKTPPTEGHSDFTRSRSEEEGTHSDACRPPDDLMADVSGPADPDGLPRLLRTHLRPAAPQGVAARDSAASEAQSAAQRGGGAPAVISQSSVTPKSAGSSSPRMLQPPRLHKRVSLPALKPGGTGSFASLKPGCSLGPLANRTKQQPPPSRGLPCFNAGPQVQSLSLCRTSLLQPRRASEPFSDLRGSHSSLEEPNQGTLRDPRSARILIPLSRSGLPKPKIP
ncbi:serine-rich coiled-coil domain-containing protein 2 isoform X1 [Trematomus bernacchii]|uniref:serine-rich coiled-coil domain-containing protein 2 isoform X1 n=1 Tax=Trematomus bernacchii TaxID=40690 RepID=UPI00146F1E9A|nr:serine-rich coiled-coil domain-containing protein 2 isoform X1 [Trematomus bernacchii]